MDLTVRITKSIMPILRTDSCYGREYTCTDNVGSVTVRHVNDTKYIDNCADISGTTVPCARQYYIDYNMSGG